MNKAPVDPAIYGKLLTRTQAQPMHSEDDYERMLEEIWALMDRGERNLSPEEASLLEIMSILMQTHKVRLRPPS